MIGERLNAHLGAHMNWRVHVHKTYLLGTRLYTDLHSHQYWHLKDLLNGHLCFRLKEGIW